LISIVSDVSEVTARIYILHVYKFIEYYNKSKIVLDIIVSLLKAWSSVGEKLDIYNTVKPVLLEFSEIENFVCFWYVFSSHMFIYLKYHWILGVYTKT